MNRLPQLEQFLRDDPSDPFNYYAVALEYLKIDARKAKTLFVELCARFPDYLPTYYPFAHLLIEEGNWPEAESIFTKGIETAKKLGDSKALRELTTAHNDWLFTRD
jgi:hypothetical protein